MKLRPGHVHRFFAPETGGAAGGDPGGTSGGGETKGGGGDPNMQGSGAGNVITLTKEHLAKLPPGFAAVENTDGFIDTLSRNWQKYSSTEEQIRTALKPGIQEEVRAERFKNRPKTAADYKVPDVKALNLPKHVRFEPDENHPMLKWWRTHAWEQGLDQKGFEKGFSTWLDGQIAQLPDYDKELEKLGKDGKQRAAHAYGWLQGFFNVKKDEKGQIITGTAEEKRLALFDSLMTTAEGIELAEYIMGRFQGRMPGSAQEGGNDPVPGDTIENLTKQIDTIKAKPEYMNASSPEGKRLNDEAAALYDKRAKLRKQLGK